MDCDSFLPVAFASKPGGLPAPFTDEPGGGALPLPPRNDDSDESRPLPIWFRAEPAVPGPPSLPDPGPGGGFGPGLGGTVPPCGAAGVAELSVLGLGEGADERPVSVAVDGAAEALFDGGGVVVARSPPVVWSRAASDVGVEGVGPPVVGPDDVVAAGGPLVLPGLAAFPVVVLVVVVVGGACPGVVVPPGVGEPMPGGGPADSDEFGPV